MNLAGRLASCARCRLSYTCCRSSLIAKNSVIRCASPQLIGNALLARSYATTEPDSGYRFSTSHEWVSLADSNATVGVTNYAQDKLGDVVFAELPDVGLELAVEDAFGVLESVKAASDLYSPVSGKVIEVNSELAEKPELINQDPYTKGWLIKLEVKNSTEYDGLMSHSDYVKFVEESS